MSDTHRDDLADRMVEKALEEKVGGAAPPDVAGKIGTTSLAEEPARRHVSWATVVVAASLLIGVGVWAAVSSPWRSGGDKELDGKVAAIQAPYALDKSAPQPSEYYSQDEVEWKALYGETDKTRSRGHQIGAEERDKGVLFQLSREKEESYSRVPAAAEEAKSPARILSGKGDRAGAGGRGGGEAARSEALSKRKQSGADYKYPSLKLPEGEARRETAREETRAAKTASTAPTIGGFRLPAAEEAASPEPIADVEKGFPVADAVVDVPDFRGPAEPEGRDQFAKFHDNRFLTVGQQPLSTFSIDVDTGAYSFLRNCLLSETSLPPPEAVRIEELVNYFPYNYAQPAEGSPFAVHVDIAACPWQTKHRLARIALKGREIPKDKRPSSNLVFLVDVSGSMNQPNKLPLVRVGLVRLVDQLDERDRVSIVVYAGQSGCVLPSTVCTDENKTEIKDAIRTLTPGGSTNGESGIQLAYQIAKDHFVPKGANRVILCTDGDWNVGTTDTNSLKKLVADRAKDGVFLSALGFGMGNLNDHMLEQIADNGNGVYGYIDDESEIEKLFVKQLSGTLVTIAKDVKIQVEFNPAHVAGYRLIGYENRILAKEDFNDDKKDAGDIGAGHTVTALYEIVPAGVAIETPEGAPTTPSVDDLEFQAPKKELEPTEKAKTSGDMLLVKLRYKEPDGEKSTLIKHPVKDGGGTFAAAGEDFRFAAAVAAFGMALRESPYKGDITLATVEEIASAAVGEDKDRHRKEFVDLIKRARAATGGGAGGPER